MLIHDYLTSEGCARKWATSNIGVAPTDFNGWREKAAMIEEEADEIDNLAI